ncbi:MAG: hypothetical protein QXN36_08680 [Candidatus Bathyarchaeia archaeon]
MRKNRKKANIMAEDLGSKFLFGSVYLLEFLSAPDRNWQIYKKLNELYPKEPPPELIDGYKFALIALLHSIIIQVIQSPELLGIRRNEKINWAFYFGKGDRSKVHKLVDESPQGILISNLLAFRKRILKSRDWQTLKRELYSLMDFMRLFKVIFLNCYAGLNENTEEIIDPENALRMKLPGTLLIFINDERNLRHSFFDMYRFHSGKLKLEHFRRPLESYLDFPESPLETIMKNKNFFAGFKFAVIVLWYAVLKEDFMDKIDLFTRIKDAQTWRDFDSLFELLNDNIVGPFEEKTQANAIILFKTKAIPKTLNSRLIVPLEKPKKHYPLLADVFNHRPARVVSYEGSNGALNFCTVLLGLISQRELGLMKEKVRVLEFVHRQNIKGKHANNYSYALFLPCSSNIADYSRWWVFYNCATDYSGAGGFNYQYIHNFLKSFKRFIHYRRVAIDETSFFKFLKSDYVRFLETECEKATSINVLMRGALLELIVALYFVNQGFQVFVRHKSKVLGREIDVVAKKREKNFNLIYVVECKERSISASADEFDRYARVILDEMRAKTTEPVGVSQYDAIMRMLQDFEKNYIKPLQERLPEFVKEIDPNHKGNVRLKGVLATTELYEATVEFSPDVEFWTWWTLKKKLTQERVNKSFLEIIEKHLEGDVGKPISHLHFHEDYFA